MMMRIHYIACGIDNGFRYLFEPFIVIKHGLHHCYVSTVEAYRVGGVVWSIFSGLM